VILFNNAGVGRSAGKVPATVAKKGEHLGQREAAAPMFSSLFWHLRQPENTSSRDGLSVICQSELGRNSVNLWCETGIPAGLPEETVA
jgi:hypothetical protein